MAKEAELIIKAVADLTDARAAFEKMVSDIESREIKLKFSGGASGENPATFGSAGSSVSPDGGYATARLESTNIARATGSAIAVQNGTYGAGVGGLATPVAGAVGSPSRFTNNAETLSPEVAAIVQGVRLPPPTRFVAPAGSQNTLTPLDRLINNVDAYQSAALNARGQSDESAYRRQYNEIYNRGAEAGVFEGPLPRPEDRPRLTSLDRLQDRLGDTREALNRNRGLGTERAYGEQYNDAYNDAAEAGVVEGPLGRPDQKGSSGLGFGRGQIGHILLSQVSPRLALATYAGQHLYNASPNLQSAIGPGLQSVLGTQALTTGGMVAATGVGLAALAVHELETTTTETQDLNRNYDRESIVAGNDPVSQARVAAQRIVQRHDRQRAIADNFIVNGLTLGMGSILYRAAFDKSDAASEAAAQRDVTTVGNERGDLLTGFNARNERDSIGLQGPASQLAHIQEQRNTMGYALAERRMSDPNSVGELTKAQSEQTKNLDKEEKIVRDRMSIESTRQGGLNQAAAMTGSRQFYAATVKEIETNRTAEYAAFDKFQAPGLSPEEAGRQRYIISAKYAIQAQSLEKNAAFETRMGTSAVAGVTAAAGFSAAGNVYAATNASIYASGQVALARLDSRDKANYAQNYANVQAGTNAAYTANSGQTLLANTGNALGMQGATAERRAAMQGYAGGAIRTRANYAYAAADAAFHMANGAPGSEFPHAAAYSEWQQAQAEARVSDQRMVAGAIGQSAASTYAFNRDPLNARIADIRSATAQALPGVTNPIMAGMIQGAGFAQERNARQEFGDQKRITQIGQNFEARALDHSLNATTTDPVGRQAIEMSGSTLQRVAQYEASGDKEAAIQERANGGKRLALLAKEYGQSFHGEQVDLRSMAIGGTDAQDPGEVFSSIAAAQKEVETGEALKGGGSAGGGLDPKDITGGKTLNDLYTLLGQLLKASD